MKEMIKESVKAWITGVPTALLSYSLTYWVAIGIILIMGRIHGDI